MVRGAAFFVAPVVLLCLAASACGRPATSTSAPKQVFDANTQAADPTALTTFIATAQGIIGSDGHAGTIPPDQFLGLVPLSDDDRATLTSAFPSGFSATCADQLCTATADGTGGQGTLLASVHVAPFVTLSNPTLVANAHISTNFILRDGQGVEFCHVDGLTVEKLGVSRPVKGIYDRLQDGSPVLSVSDSDADFGC